MHRAVHDQGISQNVLLHHKDGTLVIKMTAMTDSLPQARIAAHLQEPGTNNS